MKAARYWSQTRPPIFWVREIPNKYSKESKAKDWEYTDDYSKAVDLNQDLMKEFGEYCKSIDVKCFFINHNRKKFL